MRSGGDNTGSSPSSTSRNASCGTYFPSTTRHTVSGVASSSPTGPHRNVQNTADTMTAIVDMPVLEPYSHGSMMLLLSNSMMTNISPVAMNGPNPWYAANETASGNAAAIHGPMYGMKRRIAHSSPHSTRLGKLPGSPTFSSPMKNPMSHRPSAIASPYVPLTIACAVR